ncbi:unnamed protein product [Pedinophyceae sp. YPF-701]|nr:unnamed protein product [Pedinophyceae sp. YPF-701]
MGALRQWLLACRPKTLVASVVPVIVAAAIGSTEVGWRALRWDLVLPCVPAALLSQVGCNLVNDAQDFLRGADTPARRGPARASQSGHFSPATVHGAGLACFAACLALCARAFLERGWPLAATVVACCAVGYAYTGGPVPLAYVGLGDLGVVATFGVGGTAAFRFILAGGRLLEPAAILAGLQVGLSATNMLAVNNLRDIATDRAAGKWTLAARLGHQRARHQVWLQSGLLLLLWLAWGVVPNTPRISGAPSLLASPALGVLGGRVLIEREDGNAFGPLLALAALCHCLLGVCLAAAIATPR